MGIVCRVFVCLACCATVLIAGERPSTEVARGRIVKLPLDHHAGDDAPRTALKTADGTLLPIVPDVRGRAFHLDPALLPFEWELTVSREADSDAVRVVRSCVWEDGVKYEFDYWCDICAIPMTHLKECECCQGPIRMRLRRVDPATDQPTREER